MTLIKSKLFEQHGIIHGFGFAGVSIADHLNSLNIKDLKHFQTSQVHSDDIIFLKRSVPESSAEILEADAFVTNERGIVCHVRTADCVPILLCDPVKKAVAAVHSGWRGTAKRIAEKTVDYFVKNFGSDPSDVIASIGPAIGENCYEVGEDVAQAFAVIARSFKRRSNPIDSTGLLPPRKTRGRNDKYFINLKEINRRMLLDAGLKNVELIPICNHCDHRFASYRRDKSEIARQSNFIVIN